MIEGEKRPLEKAYKSARVIIDSDPDCSVERFGNYSLSKNYGPDATVHFNTSWQGDSPQVFDIVVNTIKDGKPRTEHHIATDSDDLITDQNVDERSLDITLELDKTVGGRIVEVDLLGNEIVYESDERKALKEELLKADDNEEAMREDLGLNNLNDEEVLTLLNSLREDLPEHWPQTVTIPSEKGEKGPPTPRTVAYLKETVESLATQEELRLGTAKFGNLNVEAETYTDGDGEPKKVVFSLSVPRIADDGIVLFDDTAWQFDESGGKKAEGQSVDFSSLWHLPAEHPRIKLINSGSTSSLLQLKKEGPASREELAEGITYLNAAAEFILKNKSWDKTPEEE